MSLYIRTDGVRAARSEQGHDSRAEFVSGGDGVASPVYGGPRYGIGEMGIGYRDFIIPYVGPKLGDRIWRENPGRILISAGELHAFSYGTGRRTGMLLTVEAHSTATEEGRCVRAPCVTARRDPHGSGACETGPPDSAGVGIPGPRRGKGEVGRSGGIGPAVVFPFFLPFTFPILFSLNFKFKSQFEFVCVTFIPRSTVQYLYEPH
jgi:hypothetical protein